MPKSWKATDLEHSRCSMCLLSDTCIICWGSMRTSFHIISDIILWSVRIWFSFTLSCPWLCLKSSSAFHKVLLLLDLCGFWSFSEHLQMDHFNHYLGCSRHLLSLLSFGNSPPTLGMRLLLPTPGGSCGLYFRMGMWSRLAKVFLVSDTGSMRTWGCFSFSMKDPLRRIDKPQAESWRERPLAMWLETQDAAMPKVLTSVLRSVFCYLCLNLTNQVGATCLPSRVILGL